MGKKKKKTSKFRFVLKTMNWFRLNDIIQWYYNQISHFLKVSSNVHAKMHYMSLWEHSYHYAYKHYHYHMHLYEYLTSYKSDKKLFFSLSLFFLEYIKQV